MSDARIWEAMNDVEVAFLKIETLEFLVERLHNAVDLQDQAGIVNHTHALLAVLDPYIDNFEEKFDRAWNLVVKPVDIIDH